MLRIPDDVLETLYRNLLIRADSLGVGAAEMIDTVESSIADELCDYLSREYGVSVVRS